MPVKVNQRQQLIALCQWHSVGGLVELGVLHGKTTEALIKHLPNLLLWAVDTWKSGDPAQDPGPEIERRSEADTGYRSYDDVDMDAAYVGVKRLEQNYPERLQVLRMTTLEAARLFPAASIDAIFLDADHRTEAVKADLAAWIPKVRPSGVILGHDFGFHSVATALDEALPGWHQHHAGIWSLPRSEVDMDTLLADAA